MDIRTILAVNAAKAVRAAGHLLGKQGTSLPGRVALKLQPLFIKRLTEQVKGKVIVVCGTNGKTTTNNLLCSMLEAQGYKVVCNHAGANMAEGIAAAFAEAADMLGQVNADYACLEVDEATARHVFGSLQPDLCIITNLFRDQLDRYGEIDLTMEVLKEAIRTAPDARLVINGDDPLTAYLAMESGNAFVSFGISAGAGAGTRAGIQAGVQAGGQAGVQAGTRTGEAADAEAGALDAEAGAPDAEVGAPDAEAGSEVREGRCCKRCGAQLHYDVYHFSQLGVSHCPNCGFARPKIDYEALNVRLGKAGSCGDDVAGGLSFDIGGQRIEAPMSGLYNVYNLLAVWAALAETGCGTEAGYGAEAGHGAKAGRGAEAFNEVLREFKPQFGRSEVFRIGGTRVLLNLAKNPAGFNQNIAAMLEDRSLKDLIIAINDNAQDGRDISWLWDVDFDRLSDDTIRSATAGGTRAPDMRLRLKYEGIRAELAGASHRAAQEAAGPAVAGPAAAGPAVAGPAVTGPSAGPAVTGPAVTGPAVAGPATAGPATAGPEAEVMTDPEAALEAAINEKLANGCGNLYVLVNYTALYAVHKFLLARSREEASGEGEA